MPKPADYTLPDHRSSQVQPANQAVVTEKQAAGSKEKSGMDPIRDEEQKTRKEEIKYIAHRKRKRRVMLHC